MRLLVAALLVLVTLSAGAFTASGADADGPESAVAWLNATRSQLDLPPVVLDTQLSNDAAAHARYLTLNVGNPAVAGLYAHDENAALPGASDGGRRAAAASDISFNSSALSAMRSLVDVALHRRGLLNLSLKRVGIGLSQYATPANSSTVWYAVVVDVARGIDPSATSASTRPVVFPGPGMTDINSEFVGETPDPRSVTPANGRPAGFAISVEPTCGKLDAPSRADLFDPTGTPLPVYVVPPGTVLNAVGGQRTVSQVVMFAADPLESGTTYRAVIDVHCNQSNQHLDWTFTTAGPLLPRDNRGHYVVAIPTAMDFITATTRLTYTTTTDDPRHSAGHQS